MSTQHAQQSAPVLTSWKGGQTVYFTDVAVEQSLGAGIEPLRAVVGAGADTLLSPASLADWEPSKQKLAWYDKKPSVEAAVESQTTEVK
jgi:hypothetical protein